jgi:hypothetical protein
MPSSITAHLTTVSEAAAGAPFFRHCADGVELGLAPARACRGREPRSTRAQVDPGATAAADDPDGACEDESLWPAVAFPRRSLDWVDGPAGSGWLTRCGLPKLAQLLGRRQLDDGLV